MLFVIISKQIDDSNDFENYIAINRPIAAADLIEGD
jgi:hypothetical protein